MWEKLTSRNSTSGVVVFSDMVRIQIDRIYKANKITNGNNLVLVILLIL